MGEIQPTANAESLWIISAELMPGMQMPLLGLDQYKYGYGKNKAGKMGSSDSPLLRHSSSHLAEGPEELRAALMDYKKENCSLANAGALEILAWQTEACLSGGLSPIRDLNRSLL